MKAQAWVPDLCFAASGMTLQSKGETVPVRAETMR
jgi:hypothetical protein